MTEEVFLRLSGGHYNSLKSHLLSQDGKEGIAIVYCKPTYLGKTILLVADIDCVAHDSCATRTTSQLRWPGEALAKAQSVAEDNNFGLILIHSHPSGFSGFSSTDDASDQAVIPSIYNGWLGREPAPLCGSAVMTPDGAIKAHIYDRKINPQNVHVVSVNGDDILRFVDDKGKVRKTGLHSPMAFSHAMTDALSGLHAAVIGVSGTGSIVAEQLARMGVGRLTLIDFDHIEHKNLNRILNSTLVNVEQQDLKVHAFAKAVHAYAPKTIVTPIVSTIVSRRAVLASAESDVLFCCVDSQEGRQVCDLISQAFILPLIDIGVSIPTRRDSGGEVHVSDVLARLDYVQPGGASLLDREVYTPDGLRAEYLARVAPDTLASEVKDGYVKGVNVEAPPVIALNMRAASGAVMEFIARMFPFRQERNACFARTLFRLAEGEEEQFSENEFELTDSAVFARGSEAPLLRMPALEETV